MDSSATLSRMALFRSRHSPPSIRHHLRYNVWYARGPYPPRAFPRPESAMNADRQAARLSLPLWNERFAAPLAPMTGDEMHQRGWEAVDVVFVTGDAYVDHPSFAMAILARTLE